MPKSTEDAFLEFVHEELSKQRSDFEKVGLKFRLSRNEDGDLTHNLELEIAFEDNGDLVDVLEFHVIRNGQQSLTIEELRTWLPNALHDVLRQRAVRRAMP